MTWHTVMRSLHACMFVCVCASVLVNMYRYDIMYVCVHMYMYMDTHMYMYM